MKQTSKQNYSLALGRGEEWDALRCHSEVFLLLRKLLHFPCYIGEHAVDLWRHFLNASISFPRFQNKSAGVPVSSVCNAEGNSP